MTPRGEAAVAKLDMLTKAIADIERQRSAQVEIARRAHASWTDIGLGAGMSRQAAHEKWSGHARPVRADGNEPLFDL